MKNRSTLVAMILPQLFIMVSCGSKSSDNSTTACNPTSTNVTKIASGQAATLDLSGTVGSKYVIAPYTLGNTSSIYGAQTSGQTFTIAATGAALASFAPTEFQHDSAREISDGLRILVNRFEPKLGMNQPEGFWPLADHLDDVISHNRSQSGLLKPITLRSQYTKRVRSHSSNLLENTSETNLTTTSCPTSIPLISNTAKTFSVSASDSFDGTSYCLITASNPVKDHSETTDKIKVSISTIISTYKTIYGDQFTANTLNGYTFKPVIVIVDPGDSTMWPAGDANYKFTGAFSRDATTVSHMPILYLMDNMSDVDSSATTAAKAASLDHATLAHEMEHAIADYYRNRGTVTKDLETAYDEGIAHLFEDAFGYGEENFSKYVQAFLSSLPDGAPFLVQSDSTNYKINAASSRGGANALMYYLALQAGGFTVTDGRPTSGTGMTAIVNMVKDTTHSGVASLTTNFSTCDWTTKIGTFIGSFFNDNRTGASSDQAFTLATYDGIKDLEGNANKTFGLRFNNFRSFTTVNTNTVTEVKDGAEVFHYATQPILVTTSAADAKVTVTAPAVENSAVTLIKLP